MRSKKPAEGGGKLSFSWFLGKSILDPEDGGDMFFRNARFSSKYAAFQPRRHHSS
jgi:hypothetical protein